MRMNPKAKGVKNLTTEWSCKWFDVIKFTYGVQTHYRIRSPGEGIFAVVVRKDGKLVMIRQTRPFFDRPLLEFVCGGIEKGETPRQTAIREIAEETGYKVISIKEILYFSPNPAGSVYNVHLLVARVGNNPAHPPLEKDLPDSKVVAISIKDALKAIRKNKLISYAVITLLYYLQFGKTQRK